MPCRATQDGQVRVESSDKMWSIGGGNGKLLQYSCRENPMNSTKRQKHKIRKTSTPGQKVLLGKIKGQLLTAPVRMKSAGPKQEWHSILEVCAGESKLWCCKEQYCIGIWNVTSMNQGTLDMVKQEIVRLNSNILGISSVQSLSHVRLCNPMNCSTPGFSIYHRLLELAQTHVHWVSDAIQPSNPLSSPSPPAFNLSQYQDIF